MKTIHREVVLTLVLFGRLGRTNRSLLLSLLFQLSFDLFLERLLSLFCFLLILLLCLLFIGFAHSCGNGGDLNVLTRVA